jgi:hypothetical protein
MDKVIDYGVLLCKHGSFKQGEYTVVWKNWSTDIFGEYNLKKEGSILTNTDAVTQPVNPVGIPTPTRNTTTNHGQI